VDLSKCLLYNKNKIILIYIYIYIYFKDFFGIIIGVWEILLMCCVLGEVYSIDNKLIQCEIIIYGFFKEKKNLYLINSV